MLRAVLRKELREILGIILLALVAYGILVMAVENPKFSLNSFIGMGRVPPAPFVIDAFLPCFFFISAATALALGFRQTLGESIRGTYAFLFHRPASRQWLIGIKLLVGMTAYCTCAALPIVVHGLWAAKPGTHPGPFQWSMTSDGWAIWYCMTLLYLGAFLSGIRPARWFGSRLLPLVAAPTILVLNRVVAEHTLGAFPWPLCIVVAADAAFILCILSVAHSRNS